MIHSQLPDVGENLFASGPPRTSRDSVGRAVYGWTDEIRRLGTRDDINEIFHGIGHATQVFWDTTFSLGCGVIKCDDGRTSVVCHYYPA
ncbi:hypothetical protein TELCIR_03095 [Teladorsagia circumcincta]|uniref:SCP domain-containing protein n=1 Tax=Teladorsagia circumcincta TaxID=45464 RepID=A0A2G9UYS5_TELCI|nr:hypothetical protein TELCIR_03095 [Teladorsagia circumcincta]